MCDVEGGCGQQVLCRLLLHSPEQFRWLYRRFRKPQRFYVTKLVVFRRGNDPSLRSHERLLNQVVLYDKRTRRAGEIKPTEDIVAILTGHVLKDPDYTVSYHGGTLSFKDQRGRQHALTAHFANAFVKVPAERNAIMRALSL